MKSFYFFACLLFLAGCKKDGGSSQCNLEESQLFINGSSDQNEKQTYQYDSQGRITKAGSSGFTRKYEYYADSVVVTSDYQNGMTYFLNHSGLADSAKMRYPASTNTNGLKLEYTYTYDVNGFLVQVRQIFSQLYNGNILRDTVFLNYTVLNGQIIKSTDTQSPQDQYYEYTTTAMPANNRELNIFPSYEGKFLGKAPANLVSKIKDQAGNVISTFSYFFDVSGNVSKKKAVDGSATAGTVVSEFKYQCN